MKQKTMIEAIYVSSKPQLSRQEVLDLIEDKVNNLYNLKEPNDKTLIDLLKQPVLNYEDFTRLFTAKLKIEHKIALIENPACPEGYLNMLGMRRDLRPAVARSHKVNPKLLETMSEDKDPAVRLAVAQNPICSSSILKKLTSDQDSNIRNLALSRLTE